MQRLSPWQSSRIISGANSIELVGESVRGIIMAEFFVEAGRLCEALRGLTQRGNIVIRRVVSVERMDDGAWRIVTTTMDLSAGTTDRREA
jgi:hypothetical protein